MEVRQHDAPKAAFETDDMKLAMKAGKLRNSRKIRRSIEGSFAATEIALPVTREASTMYWPSRRL